MDKILDKEPVKRVQTFLSNFDIKLKVLVLNRTAKTAKEAAISLKCEEGAIVKSLLFKVNNFFLICLISGDKRCSLKKLKEFLKEKNVSMASANEVKKITGFSIGGVAPIAHLTKVDILIDKSLKRYDYVYAAAGHPSCVFNINYNELIKMTNGFESEISE